MLNLLALNCYESSSGKAARVRNWIILNTLYLGTETNTFLVSKEKACINIKNRLNEWSGNNLNEISGFSLRQGANFVTYKQLQTTLLNSVNNAITIEDYIIASRHSALSIEINNKYEYISTDDDLYKYLNIDVNTKIRLSLQQNFKKPRTNKKTDGKFFIYSYFGDVGVLCKNGKKHTRCMMKPSDFSLDYLIKTYGLQPLTFDTEKEALYFLANHYFTDYDREKPHSWYYIGNFNDISLNPQKDVLDLFKEYNITDNYYVVGITDNYSSNYLAQITPKKVRMTGHYDNAIHLPTRQAALKKIIHLKEKVAHCKFSIVHIIDRKIADCEEV